MRLPLALAVLALLAPVGMAAIGPEPSLALVGNQVTVSIFGYSPAVVVIPVGGSVTWEIHEDLSHTVTGVLSTPPDSGVMQPHTLYTATFTQAGLVPYRCLIHPNMVGAVEVVG